ncbi:hypothetical protein F2Q70_00012115 [Brassica cretica]|uniref:Uncharacterized protein n=1 Tax=Brassica cretica TaxID=69181 RepID=A0A8S9M4V0_BRACR|nr:hypothetical protein F2Q70_00012115 [Brassica cretica]KAF3547742.1 hypothetical protein DY000_02007921 [Brassica cretica]
MSADRKGKTNGSTGEAKKLTIEDLFIKICLNTLASEENTNREHRRRFEIVRVYMCLQIQLLAGLEESVIGRRIVHSFCIIPANIEEVYWSYNGVGRLGSSIKGV